MALKTISFKNLAAYYKMGYHLAETFAFKEDAMLYAKDLDKKAYTKEVVLVKPLPGMVEHYFLLWK